MTLAFVLLGYGLVVATMAPPLLRRLTRRGSAPRLGITAWLVAIASTLGAGVLAAGILTFEATEYWRDADDAVLACYNVLSLPVHEHWSLAAQLAIYATAGLVVAGSIVAAARSARYLLHMRRRTFAHARQVRLVGRRVPGVGAVVLDSAEPQAYCVAGRPDTIVVTSAALEALTEDQLAAVLAHEQAHLSGRHASMTAALRGLKDSLPRVRLVAVGAAEIARLLEMCADDTAARTHGPESLLGGLLALVGASEPVPERALAAAGVAVLARAERLVDPVSAARRAATRTALLGMIMTIAGGLLGVCVWFGGSMMG